jgi:hypothetical protein
VIKLHGVHNIQIPSPGRSVSAGVLVRNYDATNMALTQKDQPFLSSKKRLLFYYYYYLTVNGLSPGGSGTTIRQQTNNTHKHVQTKHIKQTISRKTQAH